MKDWEHALSEVPLIAILRGLKPDNAVSVADVLVDNGFRMIEVPLNSPDPLKSIEAISRKYGERIFVGAGTVTRPEEVVQVENAGGELIVAPNLNKAVGEAATSRQMIWCPGVLSPSEAFDALEHKAALLKIFPAEMVPAKAVKALRAVLPAEARMCMVGGVSPDTMAEYVEAGANGFGLGSALFRPDLDMAEIARRAADFMREFRAIKAMT